MIRMQLKINFQTEYSWYEFRVDHIYQPLRSGRICHKVDF